MANVRAREQKHAYIKKMRIKGKEELQKRDEAKYGHLISEPIIKESKDASDQFSVDIDLVTGIRSIKNTEGKVVFTIPCLDRKENLFWRKENFIVYHDSVVVENKYVVICGRYVRELDTVERILIWDLSKPEQCLRYVNNDNPQMGFINLYIPDTQELVRITKVSVLPDYSQIEFINFSKQTREVVVLNNRATFACLLDNKKEMLYFTHLANKCFIIDLLTKKIKAVPLPESEIVIGKVPGCNVLVTKYGDRLSYIDMTTQAVYGVHWVNENDMMSDNYNNKTIVTDKELAYLVKAEGGGMQYKTIAHPYALPLKPEEHALLDSEVKDPNSKLTGDIWNIVSGYASGSPVSFYKPLDSRASKVSEASVSAATPNQSQA